MASALEEYVGRVCWYLGRMGVPYDPKDVREYVRANGTEEEPSAAAVAYWDNHQATQFGGDG